MDDRHHLPVPVGHDHSLYQTGYVNKEYLISRSNEGSDNSKPMLFPDPCKAEWQKTSDNHLRMHVQIKSVRFSDGTEMEYPDEKRPSAGWKIYYQA